VELSLKFVDFSAFDPLPLSKKNGIHLKRYGNKKYLFSEDSIAQESKPGYW
jgi:hypothetical protein